MINIPIKRGQGKVPWLKLGRCAFDDTGYSEQVWADLVTHWNKTCGLGF